MNKKERTKALEQIKQLCDFMIDETGTVKFEQTGEECLLMINALIALKETAQLFLEKECLGVK